MIPDKRLAALSLGRIYLWTLLTDDASAAERVCRFDEVLSEDEKKEACRFRRATARHQFVAARVLLRLALSSHFAVPASAWRFERDCNRRPSIAAPALLAPVRFSVSHTEGLVACLITLSAEAAVDVEKLEHDEDLDLVAKEVLTPFEHKTLTALSGTDRTTRFYDHWTLKEAYAKARGLGLSLPLNSIGFDLMQDNTISARFANTIDDDPADWLFWCRHLYPQHTVSLAAKRVAGEEIKIVVRPVKFDEEEIALVA